MASTQPSLQMPAFYKPDPNSPQVYDAQGNAVTYDQYIAAGGQPDFSNVQQAKPPGPQSTQFDPSSIGITPDVWANLTPSMQAVYQAAGQYNTQQQLLGKGQQSVNAELFNQALAKAATDPTILSTYGDAAKMAVQNLQFQLQQFQANTTADQAKIAADQLQARQQLQQQIATAGQAYSGFRTQAQQQLAAQQADVIQSTRSTLQQNIQNLGSTFESQYGSGFPGTSGSSSITAGGPLTGQVTYQPVGGVLGSQLVGQSGAVNNLAQTQYGQEQLK